MEAVRDRNGPAPASAAARWPKPSPVSQISRFTQRSASFRRLSLSWCHRISLWLAGIASTVLVHADQGWEGHSLNLNWENDAIRRSDRHYTQGSRISYWSADQTAPIWARRASESVPALGFNPQALKFGFELGHEIYTPENLDATELIPDDRPYAGWLYGSASLQRRGGGRINFPTMEEFRLDLGIIGPESQAQETQKVWHSRDPRGWDHQLKTEPGFAFRYNRTHLLRVRIWSGWSIDYLPGFNASAGNIDTHFALESALQLGYNVPNRFEVPGENSRTRTRFGIYAFGKVGGRFVVHNIFLDGNTWQSSHSVDRTPWVADVEAGVTLVVKSFELTASNNYRTREFHGQDRADSFGSATLTFKF
jgi:lipid A 3-O-deacylase